MYSLREAAEAVGIGKPSLLKAIQKGRISAKKNDLGQWEIDPSELHRVYKPVARETSGTVASEQEEPVGNGLASMRLELTEKLLRQVESERDDLRRRLDASEAARETAAAETRRLTLLLTHQPPVAADIEDEEPTRAPRRGEDRGGLLWAAVLVALVVALAVGAAAWWPRLQAL